MGQNSPAVVSTPITALELTVRGANGDLGRGGTIMLAIQRNRLNLGGAGGAVGMPAPFTLEANGRGQNARFAPGQIFRVLLPENPTTGRLGRPRRRTIRKAPGAP